jgi:hypothetical protein
VENCKLNFDKWIELWFKSREDVTGHDNLVVKIFEGT